MQISRDCTAQEAESQEDIQKSLTLRQKAILAFFQKRLKQKSIVITSYKALANKFNIGQSALQKNLKSLSDVISYTFHYKITIRGKVEYNRLLIQWAPTTKCPSKELNIISVPQLKHSTETTQDILAESNGVIR